MNARDRRVSDVVGRDVPDFHFEVLEPRRLLSVSGCSNVPDDSGATPFFVVQDSGPMLMSHDGHVGGALTTFEGVLPADDYTAIIDWGDGTTPTAGHIQVNDDGTYVVTADHDYAAGGEQWINVEVYGSDGTSGFGGREAITFTDGITVTESPNLQLVTTTPEQAVEFAQNHPWLPETVGIFYDINHQAGDGSNYIVTINWGDGTSSAGVVEPYFEGGYMIAAEHHQYSTPGEYVISTTVIDTDPLTHGSATIDGRADVHDFDMNELWDHLMLPPVTDKVYRPADVATQSGLPLVDIAAEGVSGTPAASASPFSADHASTTSLASEFFKADRAVRELDNGLSVPLV